MPLTKDEELYYENYFDLFNSNGWKQFIDEQKHALEELKNNAFNGGEDRFYFTKGQVDILNKIVNFSDTMEAVYQDTVRHQEVPIDTLSV
jgi:hypothetical protein|tara:strand:+ start:506 stop:775 length:270 start_codon:yes stop_codon:yes gene_type:complete